jgi:mono/diheme cytochrome c family protein
MFRKILKWVIILVVAVVVIIAVVAYSLISSTNKKMSKAWEIEPSAITIPTDSASVARGMQLAHVLCMDCHGDGFGGREFLNDPAIGRIDAHNLTSGKGGIGGEYSDMDWVRAIRHGVTKEGRAIMIMPSSDFHHMSERDLGEIIAYIKTIPPVDKEWMEKPDIKPFAKVLIAAGAMGDVISAEKIDHGAGYEIAPVEAPNSAYGEYLVNVFGCRHCHGMELNGGPGTVPHSPFSPNLTPGGELATWSRDDFAKALRTGFKPNGQQMSNYFMPWEATKHMTDLQIDALHEYLVSLPKLETAQ